MTVPPPAPGPAQVVSMGLHIADVLGRPVSAIPPGQDLALLDQIALTVADTAAGTSLDLAKLGVRVAAVGAVGRDVLGQSLAATMAGFGIDVTHLTARDGAQTSASILAIRPNGERPALHVVGANALLAEDDVPWDVVEAAAVLHVGGALLLPRLDGEPMARVLARARAAGVTTTVDRGGRGCHPFDGQRVSVARSSRPGTPRGQAGRTTPAGDRPWR